MKSMIRLEDGQACGEERILANSKAITFPIFKCALLKGYFCVEESPSFDFFKASDVVECILERHRRLGTGTRTMTHLKRTFPLESWLFSVRQPSAQPGAKVYGADGWVHLK